MGKNCMVNPTKPNEAYTRAVANHCKAVRAKVSRLPTHEGKDIYDGLRNLAVQCKVPNVRLNVILDGVDGVGGVRGQFLAALASSSYPDVSWTGCGGSAHLCKNGDCKYPRLHSPCLVAAAGPCQVCTSGATGHAHTVVVCPNRQATLTADAEFVFEFEKQLDRAVAISASFMAAVAVQDAQGANAPSASASKPKKGGAAAKGKTTAAKSVMSWLTDAVDAGLAAYYNHGAEGGPSQAEVLLDNRVRHKVVQKLREAQAAPDVEKPTWFPARTLKNMKNESRDWVVPLCDEALSDSHAGFPIADYKTYYPLATKKVGCEVFDGCKVALKPDLNSIKYPDVGVHVVNLHHPHAREQLALHGLPMHVPCSVATCDCVTTKPTKKGELYSTSTAAPFSVLGVNGKEEPLVSGRSVCPKHGVFNHCEHGTLARLPPSLKNHFCVHPENGRAGLMLSKELAPTFEHQMVHGHGFETVVKELRQQRADVLVRRHEEYAVQARLWYAHLDALAGDKVWAELGEERKAARFDKRVQYLLVKDGVDRKLGAVPSFLADDDRAMPSAKTLRHMYLEVAEAQRYVRDATMRGYVAEVAVSLDHSAKKFGTSKWLATLCNEKSQLLSALAVPTTGADKVVRWCTAVSLRDGFTARGNDNAALVVDNVPTGLSEDEHGVPVPYLGKVCEALGLPQSVQDLFHCCQHTTSTANNNCSQYFDELILGLRNVVRVPVARYFNLVKSKLTAPGNKVVVDPIVFARARSFRGMHFAAGEQRWTEEKFDQAVNSGALYYLFTETCNVIPYEHREAANMEVMCAKLVDRLTEVCFQYDAETDTYALLTSPPPLSCNGEKSTLCT